MHDIILADIVKTNLNKAVASNKKIAVGFSGGSDSLCLLHILANHADFKHRVFAIHINHHLSVYANEWQAFVKKFCKTINVECIVKNAEILSLKNGLEDAARKERYKIFENLIDEDTTLLLAHHLNDQIETMLHRLLLGHGIQGIIGMEHSRKHKHFDVVRPFINVKKKEIINYLQLHKLNYINDPSNDNTDLTRNWIRHELLPVINSKFPSSINTLEKSRNQLREAHLLNNQLAKIDFEFVYCKNKNTININKFNLLNHARRINCLRYWININNLLFLSYKKINELVFQIYKIKPGSHPESYGKNYYFKAYSNELFLIIIKNKKLLSQKLIFKNNRCVLNNNGYLKIANIDQKNSDFLNDLYIKYPEKLNLKIHFVQNKPLKKILHEIKIPPWERYNYPLIYKDNDLFCLPNTGFCLHHSLDKKFIINWIYK